MPCCYLIHADEKLHHAQHYIGWSAYDTPWKRFSHHKANRGARLTAAWNNKGINYRIVRIWENGDKSLERELKDHHRAKSLCPICNPELHLDIPTEPLRS